MNRWCCTNEDLALAVCMIVSCSWMVFEYSRFAWTNHQTFSDRTVESVYRSHSINLRNVFVECGTIHVLSSIVAWFLPLYWAMVLLHVHNAFVAHKLNRSASEQAAYQEHLKGLNAVKLVEFLRSEADKVVEENESDVAEQYRVIIERLRDTE